MKNFFLLLGQVVILTGIYQLSVLLVTFLHLPIPASVLGMLLLLFLLSQNIIHIRYIKEGALFLNKHLAFFFIPIAVGLMTYGDLIRSDGVRLMTMIAGSSIIGLIVTSGLTAFLSNKGRERE